MRGDISLACAYVLFDQLVAGGVRHVCLSPGSRSTPLALAASRHDEIRLHVHLDERSASFFALGLAKSIGAPVAIVTTSGTAAAELFPAIVEASQARVPLVALTADRPPNLRGTGANQTIDQENLYGRYVRGYWEQPTPSNEVVDIVRWRATAQEALQVALVRSGPVHIDCPFDEPLVPAATGDGNAPTGVTNASIGEVDDREPSDGAEPIGPDVERFFARYGASEGVITIGSLRAPKTLALLSLGKLLGWPVLAEPLSGLRLAAGEAGRALSAGQMLVGDDGWLDRHPPAVVLQVGAMPTTRATQALVASGRTLVVLDEEHLDPDPLGRAETRIVVDPERFAATAWDDHQSLANPSDDWLESWRTADLVARTTIDRQLDLWREPFEGRVARDVAAFLPHGATLVIGSSTPVRDLDIFMAPRRPPRIWNAPDLLRIVSNRGASGIDGLVSTTLGAAVGSAGPTVTILGDLSFLYDAGALLWSPRLAADAVFVVIANGGGRIFSMLDQASLPEFDDLFLTSHPASIAEVTTASGAGHRLVERAADLTGALERAIRAGGVQVIEVVIDPELDRTRRAELREIVHEALASR
jgi:2-succinyl-5-enolpyruvyl-6-hydroxy-3-cyclohexene-1-carboxylate synthase